MTVRKPKRATVREFFSRVETPNGHLKYLPTLKNSPMAVALAGNVGDMLATSENVANFHSDMPIPATRFSCVGTLLCREFADIYVPKTDNIMYIVKYIDLSMYNTRLLKR